MLFVMKLPTVALVGRPNVGKSTVFNRLVGERISIVEDIPGVTRDRIYAKGHWLGREYRLIDTGGIEMEDEPLMNQIRYQAEIAIDEADVIIFLVNGQEGVTNEDEAIARMLHKSGKPIVLGVNKTDNPEQRAMIYDFYRLGVGEPIPVSGAHGTGFGDLLDEVVVNFPILEEDEDEDVISFSFIGRPNVGKSSLVNAILKEQRVIVSPIEGTTREAVDIDFTTEDGQRFNMIDTAGVRRRGKVYEKIEKYSVLRTLSAIDRSDVVCLVIDAETGILEQDKKVAGLAVEAGAGIIILVNKWDAVDKSDGKFEEMTQKIRQEFQYLSYAPILFVSAKTGQRLNKIPELVEKVSQNRSRRIQSSLLNEVLLDAIGRTPTPSKHGKRLNIYYMTQVAINPPTFVVFVNDEELMHFSYERFIENQLREAFYFEGTPIKILTRRRK